MFFFIKQLPTKTKQRLIKAKNFYKIIFVMFCFFLFFFKDEFKVSERDFTLQEVARAANEGRVCMLFFFLFSNKFFQRFVCLDEKNCQFNLFFKMNYFVLRYSPTLYWKYVKSYKRNERKYIIKLYTLFIGCSLSRHSNLFEKQKSDIFARCVINFEI